MESQEEIDRECGEREKRERERERERERKRREKRVWDRQLDCGVEVVVVLRILRLGDMMLYRSLPYVATPTALPSYSVLSMLSILCLFIHSVILSLSLFMSSCLSLFILSSLCRSM